MRRPKASPIPLSTSGGALELRLTRDIRRLDYVALFGANGDEDPREYSSDARDSRRRARPYRLGCAAARPRIDSTSPPYLSRATPRRRFWCLDEACARLYDLQRTVLEALALALAPTVLAILLIGVFFARRAMRRFERIHGAIVRIMNGELDLRLPVTDERDEIDSVARAVNLMLDEIAVLLDQLKSVGDNIAHDLRTPLMAARSRLERALEDGSRTQTRCATTMQPALSQLDRASLTISAILRISAVENDTRKKPFADVDLSADHVHRCLTSTNLSPSPNVSHLQVDFARPVVVRGDEDLMREAIANLVDNALKFTPAGGRVRIEAGTADSAPFVRVSDSGRGVAPEERDKIFVRFYTRSPQRRRRQRPRAQHRQHDRQAARI